MKQSDVNHLFAIPWASQADSSTVTPIPATATAIGRASMALGFPKATMTPLAAGGVPPFGEDMNGILAMLSVAARASEAGLLRPFSASFASAIGGYPAGATVAHPSISGRFLICTQDGNENDPASNMGGWIDPLSGLATTDSMQNFVSGIWGASFADGDLQGLGLFWQNGSQAPCFVRKGKDGSTIFTALVTRSQIDSWLAGYASNAALNAESQRAQDAENNLLSGTMGVASSAGDLRGLGVFWQGVSQAPCFIRKNADGSLTFTALVTRSQVDSWLANLASNAALNAESQRAQNAENNLLSGVLGVNASAGDLRGLGWFWQGVSTAPCFIFLGPDGKPVFKASVTREQVDAWLANLASNASLNAETIRATNAENARVAKAGDTMGGSLILNSGNAFAPWAASPQSIYQVGGGLLSVWGQVFGNGNVGLLLGGNNPGDPYRNWRFDPTAGTITTPNWNPIPEVTGFGTSRVVEQVFTTTGTSSGGSNAESWVNFPTAFAAGTTPVLSILINREPGRISRTVSLGNQGSNNQPNVTNTGFSFQPWFSDGYTVNTSGQPWTIHVRAIGVM